MKETFDLVVIGSGPAGFRAAIQAAQAGRRVAVIERGKAGGGCVHSGTIPSKSLREAALAAPPARFEEVFSRMRKVIQAESRLLSRQLEKSGVRLIQASASFRGEHEIALAGKGVPAVLQAVHFLLATGTRPLERPEFPTRLGNVFNSDSVLRLKSLPKRLLILGAGVIGCEYASVFAQLGSEVTLADRRNELLRAVDGEIIAALRNEFRGRGVALRLGAELGSLAQASRAKALELRIGKDTWRGDAVLICLGRQANTDGLGLERIGVECDERGQVKVDSSYRTNRPHIYAVGDVIGAPALAATGAEQGRIAACHLLGLPCAAFPEAFPAGIYTIPEISSYGLHESEAKERGLPFVVGRASFDKLARGLINGERRGFLKLIAHKETRKILGVHVIGSGASELIHIGQVAHSLGAPVDFFVNNVFNYPTFAEAYKVAAGNALEKLLKD